jgi:DNA-damage-inducible protein J
MPKTAMINARIEPGLKKEVEEIFSEVGLNQTEAITLFYKQVKLNSGLPFKIKIPNRETLKAIDEARKGRYSKGHKTIAGLKKGLES